MLTWNVYYGNFNSGEIEIHNVFRHGSFIADIKKALKKCGDDKEAFAQAVKRELMYYYWSKCEWEVIVSHWPPSENTERWKPEKIDVYDQVMINWDIFMDYLWNNRAELKRM